MGTERGGRASRSAVDQWAKWDRIDVPRAPVQQIEAGGVGPCLLAVGDKLLSDGISRPGLPGMTRIEAHRVMFVLLLE